MKSATRNCLLFFLGCMLFHALGTWSLPLIDRDEPRFAEASREMIQRDNFVVPYFNNQYRFDKPPLAYWAQLPSYRFFGQNDFAARFPSAIAAALTALSILAWGNRIGGAKVGWWAAIIFTLSLQTFLHAKAAVADMWLVLFVTTAHWTGFELLFGRGPPNQTSNFKHQTFIGWWLAFYFSMAFGFLAKGPVAFIPLLTIAAITWQDRQLHPGKQFAFFRGIAVTLVIILLWGIPALLQTHGEFWRVGVGKHVIARTFGPLEGHGGKSIGGFLLFLPFYFVAVFASLFPWSIKLPWLIKRVWRLRDNIDNYLVAGIAIIFILFTLAATKLPHYTLPALPLLSLLLARHLVASEFPVRRFRRIVFATAVLLIAVALIAPPFVASRFPARELFRLSRNELKPEMEFGAIDYTEPSLVWYFRSRVEGWMTELNGDTAKLFMDRTGPRFVVLPAQDLDETFPGRPSDWKTFSTTGFNIAKGKHVDLTLVLKPQ